MKTFTATAVAFLCAAGVLAAASDVAGEGTKPTLAYWHLWTDPQGRTHLTECALSGFVLQSMNRPADPQWQDRLAGGGHVIFSVQPPQWRGTWHEDPMVQWVVPLRGSWFVEAQDGTRQEWDPVWSSSARTSTAWLMRRAAGDTCQVMSAPVPSLSWWCRPVRSPSGVSPAT